MPPEQTTTPATAATTTEGQGTSVTATDTPATAAASDSTTQQAATGDTTAAATTTDDKGATQGAPEKYEFSAPDGKSFDPEVLAQFSEVAKEVNLSQEDAQKVLDKFGPVLAEKQTRMIAEARTAWVDAAKSDKEFGGDKLDENLSVAKKALESFGSPELNTLLKESGLGDHPEVIRLLFRAGKAISEDGSFVAGGRAAGGNDAKSFYPNSNMS